MLDQMIETRQELKGTKSVLRAEERLARASAEANRLRARVAHAVEDKYDDARRAVRRGKYAAEDLIDETAYRIKRDPFSSIALTFGLGLGLGAVIGWLGKRNRRDDR